jgi:hypothetical protein
VGLVLCRSSGRAGAALFAISLFATDAIAQCPRGQRCAVQSPPPQIVRPAPQAFRPAPKVVRSIPQAVSRPPINSAPQPRLVTPSVQPRGNAQPLVYRQPNAIPSSPNPATGAVVPLRVPSTSASNQITTTNSNGNRQNPYSSAILPRLTNGVSPSQSAAAPSTNPFLSAVKNTGSARSTGSNIASTNNQKTTGSNPFVGAISNGNASPATKSPSTNSGAPGSSNNPFANILSSGGPPVASTAQSAKATAPTIGGTSGSSAVQASFNATHASVGGREYVPIRQTDFSQYSGSSDASKKSVEAKMGPDACYAAVKTMIARQSGKPNATIDQFYNNPKLPDNVKVGSSAPLKNIEQLASGSDLMIIKGTVSKRDGSGIEDHYMLGTHIAGPSGNKIIIANDPWTGKQVQLDAASGKIMNPSADDLHSFTAKSYSQVTVQ